MKSNPHASVGFHREEIVMFPKIKKRVAPASFGYQPRSPSGCLVRGRMATALIAMIFLAVVAAPSHAQIAYQSAGDGFWNHPSTWNPNGIPGALDTATIQGGHTVTLCFGQDTWASVMVAGLVINEGGVLAGGIIAQHVRGFPMVVFAGNLTNDGAILGSPAWHSSGGHIFLSGGQLINRGAITAGDGHAVAPPPLPGGIIIIDYADVQNFGDIDAGLRGGVVDVFGGTILNGDQENIGRIRGGFGGLEPGIGLHCGGWAQVIGDAVSIGPGSEIRGGGGDATPNSYGGIAMVMSGEVAHQGLIRGGDGCGPGPAWLFAADKDVRGAVIAGDWTCMPWTDVGVVIDPPEGEITDGAEVAADDVALAAGNLLTVGPLDTAAAISAVDDMIITIAPGGTLDMSNLTPGTYWLSAGDSVTIRSDNITLPPGGGLADIISASTITTEPGTRFEKLLQTPSMGFHLAAGQTYDLPVTVVNVGNMSETVQWHISGLAGWWYGGPINRSRTLAPMESMEESIRIAIPEDAEPGGTSTLSLSASTGTRSVNTESEIQVTVWGRRSVPTVAKRHALVLAALLSAAGMLLIYRRSRAKVRT